MKNTSISKIAFVKGVESIVESLTNYELEINGMIKELLLNNENIIYQSDTTIRSYVRKKYKELDNGNIRDKNVISLLTNLRKPLSNLNKAKTVLNNKHLYYSELNNGEKRAKEY